jgi:hypothetical protein
MFKHDRNPLYLSVRLARRLVRLTNNSPIFKRLLASIAAPGAMGAATLHAAAAHQYRDAALYASAKTLAVLNARDRVGFALRRRAAAALRNRKIATVMGTANRSAASSLQSAESARCADALGSQHRARAC